MAKAATAEQIEQLLSDYRNRGEMTRRAFCESRGMSLSMLDYYLRRYGTESKREAAKLVRVDVESGQSAGTFTIALQNGRCIESTWNFTDAELARLIRIVEGA
jgi:hypothetical protein